MLTPNPRYQPVRKFEPSDTNHASVINAAVQELLNQAAWVKQQIDGIKTSQSAIATSLQGLSEYNDLKTQATNLLTLLQTERSQNTTADNTASTTESGITTQNTAADVEIARIAAIQTALAGITIGGNYQAYNAVLQAIAAATSNNNTYLYSSGGGVISWSNPSNLGSGTRIRDCVLKGIVASGGTAPTLTTGAWTAAPLTQTYNDATSRIAWNAGNQQLTIAAGEYMLEGLLVARSPVVQMALRQGTSITAIGTTGKGTVDTGIVTASEPLAVYSHLMYTMSVNSTTIFNPAYYVSSPGSVLTNTMGARSPWYILKISYFQY